jgi:hypothetical protein
MRIGASAFNSKMGFLRAAETIGLPCLQLARTKGDASRPDNCPCKLDTHAIATIAGSVYPLHDRDVLDTACGRICMHRKRINVSTVLAGQHLGIKEVDEGIWIVSFISYDLGFIDLEQKTLQPLDNPFGPRLSPMSWVRSVTYLSGPDTDRTRVGMVGVAGFEPTTPSPPD